MTSKPTIRFRSTPSMMAALALLALTAAGAAAQDQSAESNTATLSGVVVDAATGAQIPGALVVLLEQADPVLTDRQGRFLMDDVELGTRTLIVTQLGYDSLRTEVSFERPGAPVTLELSPDPVAIERLEVVVDQFERARNRSGVGVQVLDRLTLQQSAAFNALDLVRARSGLMPVRCGRAAATTPCAYVRGRVVPVQVYIDGAHVIGGLDIFASLPPEDLYYVEVIAGGRAINAYTTWFMESVANGRRIPRLVF